MVYLSIYFWVLKFFSFNVVIFLYTEKVDYDYRIDATNIKSDGGIVHLFELVNNFKFDNSKIEK